MSKVVDPDDLDRFQAIFSGEDEEVSLRGNGAARQAVQTDGQTDGTTTFTRAAGDFTADSVAVGDVLCLIDDPAGDTGIQGHYRVASAITATTLVVDRAIANHTGTDLTWRIFQKETTGGTTPAVADGVNMQALFSFAKEEWRVLAAGLGNAADLNKFDFPIQAISANAGEYIMGGVNLAAASAWKFAADNGVESTDDEGIPKILVRDGGWQERNAADVVISEYANYSTLGTLLATAQATFQQGDATGTPTNFKLLGVVNQAVLTFGPDVGPDAVGSGFAITGTDTIKREDGGDFVVDNYRLGDFITLRGAEDPANNGSHGPITAITGGADGDITIAGAGLTNNADDTTIILQVDHRRYTALRARTKGRTFAKALHVDGGVPTTGILPLINKFPLAHANDVATNIADNGLDDGKISGGDNTTVGDIFQETETHTSLADGVTETTPTAAADAFTLTSAAATFDVVARTIQVLQPGDSVEITDGADIGVYEVKSIDSTTVVSLFKEPLKTYTGGEATRTFIARTGIIDIGAVDGAIADVGGTTGTLTSAAATFDVDTALGDRIVTAGDIVELFSGVGAHIGYYKVISRDSATVLTLNTSDQIFTTQSAQSYRIWRPGMFLQRFNVDVTIASATNINFADANPDTLTRTGGSWITDAFLENYALRVTAAEDTANVKTYTIGNVTPTATVATLIASDAVFANAADTTASANGIIEGDYGISRTINSITYPFHWRLFANGATLEQCFQFLDRELRRTTDIDGGNGTERGDVTDVLMTYVSPNGVTLDLFPDDLSATELNNVTYKDIASNDNGDVGRKNAFIVGITFDINANLIDAPNSRLTAYFTSVPSGSFGANDAIIVDDKDGVDMNFTALAADQATTFDYTNNAQGGRTPDTDALITVIALGDDNAQHILATATISKVNSLIIPVQPALERNYVNP